MTDLEVKEEVNAQILLHYKSGSVDREVEDMENKVEVMWIVLRDLGVV